MLNGSMFFHWNIGRFVQALRTAAQPLGKLTKRVPTMPDAPQYRGYAVISQENRLIKLTTPLGADTLLPQRVIAHEKLGRTYQYTVDCLSLHRDIELKKLIAQPVTLWIRQADTSYLPVHGYVHTVKKLGSDGQFLVCQLSFAPWLDFLNFPHRCAHLARQARRRYSRGRFPDPPAGAWLLSLPAQRRAPGTGGTLVLRPVRKRLELRPPPDG